MVQPSATLQHLNKRLGGGMRKDYLRICKGIFGLGESSRLFHLRLLQVFQELGFRELKLVRWVFVLFIDGFLWAIATVHVDDLMCTGNGKGQAVFERPRKIFTFGKWKCMMKEWVKF